jgi:hypothetical protein
MRAHNRSSCLGRPAQSGTYVGRLITREMRIATLRRCGGEDGAETLMASITEQPSFLLAEFVIGKDSRVAQGSQFT